MFTLEGFHTLKSFLGCIGYMMADSGLEEVIKLVYPGDVTYISWLLLRSNRDGTVCESFKTVFGTGCYL